MLDHGGSLAAPMVLLAMLGFVGKNQKGSTLAGKFACIAKLLGFMAGHFGNLESAGTGG